MDADKAARARKLIVSVLSRENHAAIQRRAAAAGELAAEKARYEAMESEWKKEGDVGPSFGFAQKEAVIKRLEESLKWAEDGSRQTAEAMEYIALHFSDQLEKMEK